MTSHRRPLATFSEVDTHLSGVRRFVIDCPHGTTTGDLVNDPHGVIPVLELLTAKHRTEQPTCRCLVLGPEGRA